jgi:hypothetical protein
MLPLLFKSVNIKGMKATHIQGATKDPRIEGRVLHKKNIGAVETNPIQMEASNGNVRKIRLIEGIEM